MKKTITAILILFPFTLFIALYTYFAYHPEKSLNQPYTEETTQTAMSVTEVTLPMPTQVAGGAVIYDAPTDAYGHRIITSQQLYMLLPVQHISQLPELPTGCEVTSLTMVLNYLGFNVHKCELADNYLDKLDTPSGSFYDYFIGNPYSTSGWGCFAPALTNAANKYLSEQASKLSAHNISGTSIQGIFDEVSEGYPVIIWTSSNCSEETTYSPIRLGDNTVFNWPSNEHCVVLIGFNLDKSIVFLADPLNDIMECDLDVFAESYQSYYRQAVVIR